MSKSEFGSVKLAEISIEKIREKTVLLKKELFNLRFQRSLGELTNTSRFAEVRKDIARANTELTRRRNMEVKADA